MNEQLTVIGEQAAVEPILYDADAEQRIPFYLENEGERFEVVFIMGPQQDGALLEYERQLDQRSSQADQQEVGERNAVESTSRDFDASLWLFNDRLIDVEGFGEPGEEKPENWKDLIGDDNDKVAVVDDAYMAAMVVTPPLATPGKVLKWKAKRAEIIPMKALFNGFELDLTHERQVQLEAEHLSEFNSIMRRRWLVQGRKVGTPEARAALKSQRLGQLYDSLQYRTTGYSGRVPLHHKTLIVTHDLGKAGEAVRKNLKDSPAQ